MIEIRWHGRGGQGGFTASKLLGAAASLYENKHALAFPSFGPERRGAPVLAFNKISDQKISDRSEVVKCDYIVILDSTLYKDAFLDDLKKNGKILINSDNPNTIFSKNTEKIITIDATSLAIKYLKKPITNTAMLAFFVSITNLVKLDSLVNVLSNYMDGENLKKNVLLIEDIYKECKED